MERALTKLLPTNSFHRRIITSVSINVSDRYRDGLRNGMRAPWEHDIYMRQHSINSDCNHVATSSRWTAVILCCIDQAFLFRP